MLPFQSKANVTSERYRKTKTIGWPIDGCDDGLGYWTKARADQWNQRLISFDDLYHFLGLYEFAKSAPATKNLDPAQ